MIFKVSPTGVTFQLLRLIGPPSQGKKHPCGLKDLAEAPWRLLFFSLSLTEQLRAKSSTTNGKVNKTQALPSGNSVWGRDSQSKGQLQKSNLRA